MKRIAVYALGGNALRSPGGDDERAAAVLAGVMSDVVDLLEAGWSVVLTHGNGPQVGELMAMDHTRAHSLSAWVAATQGMIGHELSLNLHAILERRERPERTVVMATHVEVDMGDTAFQRPTKPVGPVLDAATVMSADWDIAETIHGPRRVVASPKPLNVVEIDAIRHLVELGAVVVCGGGGGVPVGWNGDHRVGAPAVVDKDLLSCRLALDLEADLLVIGTATDSVYTDFGSGQAKALRTITPAQAAELDADGHFPNGSMRPKVRALAAFVEQRSAGRSVLCLPGQALAALRGDSGTTFRSNNVLDQESPS